MRRLIRMPDVIILELYDGLLFKEGLSIDALRAQ